MLTRTSVGGRVTALQIERLVADAMTSPVRITVGQTGVANADVIQVCVHAFQLSMQASITAACCPAVMRAPDVRKKTERPVLVSDRTLLA